MNIVHFYWRRSSKLKETTTSFQLEAYKKQVLSVFKNIALTWFSLSLYSLKKFLEMFIIFELNAINVILRHKMFDIQFELESFVKN